jgi:hypothetical protein
MVGLTVACSNGIHGAQKNPNGKELFYFRFLFHLAFIISMGFSSTTIEYRFFTRCWNYTNQVVVYQ